MFWLNGMPGVGKSTIACSVVEVLRYSGVPTVSFFCQRAVQDRNDGKRIVQTLIYGLACDLPQFRECLLSELAKREFDTDDPAPPVHYSNEQKKIFHTSLKATEYAGKAVLLLDALDECSGESNQVRLAKWLFELTQECNWLKVIVTSRPYPVIFKYFTTGNIAEKIRVLTIDYTTSPDNPHALSTFDDVVSYTRHRFPGVDDETVSLLAEKAQGLFQWTAIASKYFQRAVVKQKVIQRLLVVSPRHSQSVMQKLYEY